MISSEQPTKIMVDEISFSMPFFIHNEIFFFDCLHAFLIAFQLPCAAALSFPKDKSKILL